VRAVGKQGAQHDLPRLPAGVGVVYGDGDGTGAIRRRIGDVRHDDVAVGRYHRRQFGAGIDNRRLVYRWDIYLGKLGYAKVVAILSI